MARQVKRGDVTDLSISLIPFSFFLFKQLRRPPGRSARRALLVLPTIARKTPNAKRDGCFHDRDNLADPACTRVRARARARDPLKFSS